MIDALITGKIRGNAVQKMSGGGKPYFTAKVRTPVGDEMDCFANVIAFDQEVGQALMALGDGDAVTIAGTLKPTAWTDKTGTARPSIDVVATAVLTAYHVTRKRKAVHGSDGEPKPAGRPSHDAWKARKLKEDHTGLDDGAPLEF